MNESQILNYIEDDDKLSHEWFIYQGSEDSNHTGQWFSILHL